MITAQTGWIGTWQPGIGDPTLYGWFTVVAYACAAWMVHRVIVSEALLQPWSSRHEKRMWWCLMFGLLLLGVNKQLDLQSALTELGRILAHAQGWYEDRRRVQLAAIAVLGVLGLTLCLMLVWLALSVPRSTILALLGAVLLLGFVGMRAMSFHHMDAFINQHWVGLRMNVVIENGALALVAVGAWLRARESL